MFKIAFFHLIFYGEQKSPTAVVLVYCFNTFITSYGNSFLGCFLTPSFRIRFCCFRQVFFLFGKELWKTLFALLRNRFLRRKQVLIFCSEDVERQKLLLVEKNFSEQRQSQAKVMPWICSEIQGLYVFTDIELHFKRVKIIDLVRSSSFRRSLE